MACRPSRRPSGLLRVVAAVLLLGFGLAAPLACAQTFDATNLRGPQDLAATWLIHAGDDPAFARSDFDDSQWLPYDSTSSLKNTIKSSQPEVIWYRLHVKVDPSQTGLALLEWEISKAFDVYVNGERLLGIGEVKPFVPFSVSARLIRRIPDRQIATGHLVIALRVHITTLEWSAPSPGLIAMNLTLGQESSLREHAWLAVIAGGFFGWFEWFSILGLGIVAIALFASQRKQKEYLWIFLQSACGAASIPLACYEIFHTLPAAWDLLAVGLGVLRLIFHLLIYLAFLRVRLNRGMRILVVVMAAGLALAGWADTQGSIPLPALLLSQLPAFILVGAVIPILLLIHWRRGNSEAGILLIPAIFQTVVHYLQAIVTLISQIPGVSNDTAMHAIGLVFSSQVGPIALDWTSISSLFYMLSLALIIILRSTRISRQQALLESEVAAAQQVQQVILPEQLHAVPGFLVESIYKPAQQVGGDFFQIVPDKDDDSLLIVAGDVTGKGLKAGMMVALLVGAIRSTAETTRDPLALLEALNRRLLGRGDAQATCLALHVAADGSATLANAGHLPPYLNGEPVPMEGALPLGMVEGAAFSVMRFKLIESDRLMLISDGVAEARNAKGDLFGFDRVLDLLRTRQTAEEVATAAQNFGQDDDISVISITRSIVLEPALT